MPKRYYPVGTTRDKTATFTIRRQANISPEMDAAIIAWAKQEGVSEAKALRLLLARGLGAKPASMAREHRGLVKDLGKLIKQYAAVS